MSIGAAPYVRVVVVNYNAGPRILRCVEHLRQTRWPKDRLEIVVVDNASTDGSVELLTTKYRDVAVLRSPANLGFAGGSNFGMRSLDGVDFVALVNNDAFVDSGWLEPLVTAFDGADDVGAACPKILFEPRFVACEIRSEGFHPAGGDMRDLSLMLTGVRHRGVDRWRGLHINSGGYGDERDPQGHPFRWLAPESTLWIPVGDGAEPGGVRLQLRGERRKSGVIRCGDQSLEIEVDQEPRWFDLPVSDRVFDVVNNAGSVLVGSGFGADRGFRERDEGQFDTSAEVFAWCGAAVVLSAKYLDEVGLFDGDYFLYYEDFDLSWRGRLQGWRYQYEPASVVRHIHAASTEEHSALFEHYVSRNRLLTLVKNAPTSVVRRELAKYVTELLQIGAGEVLIPMIRRRPAHKERSVRRLRSAAGFARLVPHAVRGRREVGRRRVLDRSSVLDFASLAGRGGPTRADAL